MKTYRGLITELESNQVFVFGSNTQGRHGAGAALFAKEKYGAIYGKAYGPQGQSYAIITKDLTAKKHPSVPRDMIVTQIIALYLYARGNPSFDFMIAYSGTGINLNGYTPVEMAAMFATSGYIPPNIIFEESFSKLVIQAGALT